MICWNCGKEFEICMMSPSMDFVFRGSILSLHAVFCSDECLIEGIKVLEMILKNLKRDIKNDVQDKVTYYLFKWLMKNKKESWELRGVMPERAGMPDYDYDFEVEES